MNTLVNTLGRAIRGLVEPFSEGLHFVFFFHIFFYFFKELPSLTPTLYTCFVLRRYVSDYSIY